MFLFLYALLGRFSPYVPNLDIEDVEGEHVQIKDPHFKDQVECQ